jgi:hypothetical protein
MVFTKNKHRRTKQPLPSSALVQGRLGPDKEPKASGEDREQRDTKQPAPEDRGHTRLVGQK